MVGNESQFVGLEKLVDLESYRNWVKARAENTELDKKLSAIERILEQNNDTDVDYRNLLLYFLTKEEERVVESSKKRKEKEDDGDIYEHDKNDCSADEEVNDPQYELFLNSLKELEKSYVLKHENNGQHSIIIYEEEEEDEILDNGCEPEEPRRKLRSAMKEKNGPLNQMTPCVEKRKLRNRVEGENVERLKLSTNGIVPDPDYRFFVRNLKIVDNHYVFTYGGDSVVYEGEIIGVKEDEHNDESDSGVEILELDRTSFYRYLNNPNVVASIDCRENSEFRQQLIDILRKPYDEEEYDRLLVNVEARKQEVRHKDLRHGRDLSCSTDKIGKSYLDHYPDFRDLLELEDDKLRCLNLLRGFFFWLTHRPMKEAFQPWEDKEYVVINPESC